MISKTVNTLKSFAGRVIKLTLTNTKFEKHIVILEKSGAKTMDKGTNQRQRLTERDDVMA